MKAFPVLCALAALLAVPARAQDADPADPADNADETIVMHHELPENRITVLATGLRERLDWTGAQVTIFEREDMIEVQGADLTRLLARAPGVTASRNGPQGAFTGIRVRGAEAEQLLVMLDGVRMADPAAPSGGFDFGTLAMGNLAKVELQRSSNSTIWGSDAIGGVLLLRSGGAGLADLSVEYGTQDALYAAGGFGGDLGPLAISLRGGWLSGDGFSAAEGGEEADGYRQSELSAAANGEIARGLSLFAHARHAEGRVEIDGFPAPDFTLADTHEYQLTRQTSGAAGLRYHRRALDLSIALSSADTARENYDPAIGADPGYTTDGTSRRAHLRGRAGLTGALDLHFGGEREWLGFSTLFDPRRKTAISGAFVQLDHDRDRLHLAIGIRRDEHRDFGGAWSLGADGSLDLTGRMRLTGSYGEGFKAPSLFQLHSDFGNAALQPERSRSCDAGLQFDGTELDLRMIAFRRDTTSQIGFVSCFGAITGICAGRPFGTYDNIGRTRAQGLEIEARWQFAASLDAGAVYALVDTEDRSPGSAIIGNALARRPRHAGTAMLDWQASEEVSLGADLRVVSASFDDAANTVRLGGYEILDLRARWRLGDALELFGRIENVWDERYQTAAGYATQGRAGHVGVRARL